MNKKRFLFSLIMAVALIAAFVPMQGDQAFAAAKKPAKAKITAFTQSAKMNSKGTYTLTGKWKAAKNAKKYKVIIKQDGKQVYAKTVKKTVKKVAYTKAVIGSKYTLSVQSLNGKQKAKAATKNRTVADKRADVKSVAIVSDSTTVGSTLKAEINPAAAAKDATISWYYVGSDKVLATSDSYVAKAGDVGRQLTVTAVVSGSTTYKDAVLTGTMTGTVMDTPRTDFYAAGIPVVAGGTPAAVITNPNFVPDSDSVEYEWKEDGKTELKNATAATYAQQKADVQLTCVVSYKVGGVSKELTIDFGKVAKAIETDYKLVVKNKAGEEATTIEAGDSLTAAVVSRTDATAAYPGAVTYEWSYTDQDGNKVVLSNAATVSDTAVIGAGIESVSLAVTVQQTKDANYSGSFSGTYTAGRDTVKSIAISGDAVAAGTLTAKVTGLAGSDMSKTATIAWQAYNEETQGWADIAAGTVGNDTYTVAAVDYGKKLRARALVTGETYVESNEVTVEKAEITGVALKWMDGSVAKDVTIGQPIAAVVEPEALASAVDITYYASTDKADVENAVAAAKLDAAPASAEADKYYGAKIALKEGVTYATIAAGKDAAEAVKPVAEKTPAIQTVTIAAKNGDADVTLGGNVVLKEGYVLTATAATDEYTSGQKLTYQWFRGNDKNPVGAATEDATYTLTGDDIGLSKIGVKVFCEGHYDPATVQGWLEKGTNYKEIKAADQDMKASAAFATKVGEKCVVTGAPEGAEYVWTAVDIADASKTPVTLTPAGSDKAGELTIPAEAYNHKISVAVTCDGYRDFAATQADYVKEHGTAALSLTGSNTPVMANVDSDEFLTAELDKADAQDGTEFTWVMVSADKTTKSNSYVKAATFGYLKSASEKDAAYIYAQVNAKEGFGGGTIKSDKMAVYNAADDSWTLADNAF